MADIKDILNDDPGELSEDELMHFLQQPHDMDAAFSNDAQEGLGSFNNNDKLQQYVAQLNQNLQQQLHTRKQQKEKRKIRHLSWPLVALVIIITLCLLGYIIIRLYHNRYP
jgi:ABC-type uncharacterized transport system involved in gliding motility auxiliary subunit